MPGRSPATASGGKRNPLAALRSDPLVHPPGPLESSYLRYFAVIVHPAAALLTIGLFIIHVYMGTAMERGAFGSVIRGDVSVGWAKKYHRVWYEHLLRDASARK